MSELITTDTIYAMIDAKSIEISMREADIVKLESALAILSKPKLKVDQNKEGKIMIARIKEQIAKHNDEIKKLKEKQEELRNKLPK